MPHVDRRPGEGLESMVKRFRRELQQSGQLRDFRRKRFFVSKSEYKRDKKRRAERRRRRREARLKQREVRRQRRP